MGVAYVSEISNKTATVLTSSGEEIQFDHGDGIESPPIIHADMLWPKGFEKNRITFEGKNLPESLILLDGGWPQCHYYNQRKSSPQN